MHLYKIQLLTIVLLIGCSTNKTIPKDYDYTPVLLHLSQTKQHDSIGFNLVTSIPELLYPKILTGDLAIWETSEKRNVIGAQEFATLEKSANTPFVRNNDLFIHEYWKIFKKNYDFGIQGFTFTGKSKNGKIINYGYIDAPDILNLLKSTSIPTNANGPANLTYWEALHSKKYQFNLVQFGNNNFQTGAQMSTLLQYQAIHDPKLFRELTQIETNKRLTYRILPPTINSNEENNTSYTILEDYINKNKQTILNATRSGHFKDIIYLPWKVDNITVTEVWKRYKNIPFQELESIEFFIDKHAIVLNKVQLEELNVKINLQGLEEYLSEKRFSFIIEKINDQEIKPQESKKYYESLLTKDWKNLMN